MDMHDQHPSTEGHSPKSLAKAGSRSLPRTQLDLEIDLYESVLQRSPNFVEVLRVLANNLSAKGDHRRSVECDRRLTRLCPEDPNAHYNLACGYCQLGSLDDCLRSLGNALRCGYRDFDYLKSDRDLEAVRKDPRFRALLRRYGGLGKTKSA